MNADYRYLTPDEAGKILGVTRSQISVWIRAGLLKALNVGDGTKRPRWQISETDLINFHRPILKRGRKKATDSNPIEKHVVKEPVVDPMELTIQELLEENRQLRKELDKAKERNKKLIENLLDVLANNE